MPWSADRLARSCPGMNPSAADLLPSIGAASPQVEKQVGVQPVRVSETRAWLAQIGGFLRRAATAEGGVAVWEAAEAPDHRAVPPGIVDGAARGRVDGIVPQP